ncbi:hypothetical protein K9M74_02145 [Candidatus Woesearchaeota archaeon]|nr:hypothetical protein [Candidatus Woesearchaeota archaeon]
MRLPILLTILLVSLLFLSACSGGAFPGANRDNPNKDYYRGTEGVYMRFSDPSSPPPNLYYYQGASRSENGFQVLVDLQNRGSSWTKGGLYVSGYNPYMIEFDGVMIAKYGGSWQDCHLDLGSLGGTATGLLRCSELGLDGYANQAGAGLRVNSVGSLLQQFGLAKQDTLFNNIIENVGFSLENDGLGGQVSVNLQDIIDIDFMNHGTGMLVLIDRLSLDNYNGYEYVLAPNSPEYPGGESDVVAFDGNVVGWQTGDDRADASFMVTNCYAYATYANPQICVDPDPYSENRKVCTPKKITYNGGNGAPVAVTTVEQENTKRGIYFTINFKNVGDGSVFDFGYLERCSPYYPGKLTSQQLDKIYLLDVRVNDQQLDCTPKRGEGIRLVNGQGSVRCYYSYEYLTSTSAYEAPLHIEAAYGYAEYIQRNSIITLAN